MIAREKSRARGWKHETVVSMKEYKQEKIAERETESIKVQKNEGLRTDSPNKWKKYHMKALRKKSMKE